MNKFNLQKLLAFCKTLKVLYIEDNKEDRGQMIKMLSNFFDHITVAVNGEKGLELYRKYFSNTHSYYDLVLSDIQMPKLDGIGMCREIYKINKKQKVLIVSAYSDKKYLIDLINLGVNGFMQKPLSFELLTESISELCLTFKSSNIVDLGENFTYDCISRVVLQNGKRVNLSCNELKLIELFIDNTKQSFTPKDIFNHIFFDKPYKDFSGDSIKGLLKRLRKKLPDGLIFNNRALGYSIKLP